MPLSILIQVWHHYLGTDVPITPRLSCLVYLQRSGTSCWFARRHKVPIQRSAFTYWEDDIPTGLDLGKNKYGGPFTTEKVENVKAFFGIIYIFISYGQCTCIPK